MQSNGEKFVFLVFHRRRFPLASYLLVQKFGARNILAMNISAHVLHRWPLMRKLPHKHVHQQAVVAGNCRKTVCSLVKNVSKNCREHFINKMQNESSNRQHPTYKNAQLRKRNSRVVNNYG